MESKDQGGLPPSLTWMMLMHMAVRARPNTRYTVVIIMKAGCCREGRGSVVMTGVVRGECDGCCGRDGEGYV